MNKKLVIMGGGGGLVLAIAAFAVVSLAGVPKEEVNWEDERGKESYYTGEQLTQDLDEITVNLKGSKGKRFLSIAVTAVYRLGPELEEAASVFTAKKVIIIDRLTMLLSGKSYADLEGKEKKELIKLEIKDRLQKTVFPELKGRIEEILYRQFYVQ